MHNRLLYKFHNEPWLCYIDKLEKKKPWTRRASWGKEGREGKEEREREKEGRKVGGEGWVPIIGGKDERVFWSFQKYDRCQ